MITTLLFLLSSMFRRQFADGQTKRMDALPGGMLIYIEDGAGRLRLNGRNTPFQPNQLYFAERGAALEFEPQHGTATCVILFMRALHIGRSAAKWQLTELSPSGQSPFVTGLIPLGDAVTLHARLEELHQLYASAGDRFRSNARFQELLQFIIAHAPDQQDDTAADAERGIEQSIAHMHDHFHEKIKLETLAAFCGFTPSSYSREFKKSKGVSPIDYLNAYRIAKAKRMLMDNRTTVRDVAAASGFGNEFYFSRMFKREVGMSPSLYVKRRDARIAAISILRFQDAMRSLGIEPVCAMNCHKSKTMSEPEHREVLEQRLNLIREARPELIVCDHYQRPYLDRLKQIAPTVILGLNMDWRAVHRQIAEVIGRQGEAEHNLRMYDQTLEHVKPAIRHSYGQKTVTYMRVLFKLIRIQGSGNHPLNDLFYKDLGLKPGFCVPGNMMHTEFSPDCYQLADTEHLFVQTEFARPEDEAVFHDLQNSAGWHAIKAVNRDCIRYTPNWVAMSWSPNGRLSIMNALLEDSTGSFTG